jgi:hypothetical protein
MIHRPMPSRMIVMGGKAMTSSPFQVPPQIKSEMFVTRSIRLTPPVSLAAMLGNVP